MSLGRGGVESYIFSLRLEILNCIPGVPPPPRPEARNVGLTPAGDTSSRRTLKECIREGDVDRC